MPEVHLSPILYVFHPFDGLFIPETSASSLPPSSSLRHLSFLIDHLLEHVPVFQLLLSLSMSFFLFD